MTTNREIARDILRPDACLHCVNIGTALVFRLWNMFIAAVIREDESIAETIQDISAKIIAGFMANDREAVARAVLLLAEWEDYRGPLLDVIPREALEEFAERLRAEIAESKK